MRKTILFLVVSLVCAGIHAQDSDNELVDNGPWKTENFSGLKFRSIGPAFMSGRIADIAIVPDDDNVWYIGVGSGGVWKTVNAGVTWQPIFDDQQSYSIGCVALDPNNPSTVWVGTGENVGGRHVGFGDGIYRSRDAGANWENLGLSKSEHISEIIVHPKNSDVVYVAAQGPLWTSGGERGFYKTIDGGKSWKRTLGDEKWTGVTDIEIDPRDPNRIYAATWDRHRTVAAYMGGGPGTGLHRSDDGGETWIELSKGLPKSNMGKIGLAVSPHQPETIYAAIELDRRKGGLYRSDDRGNTWSKQSDTVSGGTGPHYYQELYACPHNLHRIYLMDVRMQVSDDGGKTFRRVTEQHKHSDNHALAFRADDPDYLLCGTDGGLYESFDLAANWRFIDNLPVTQFYKIALDDTEPFYNIYGGTQDNATEGGPSRTDNAQGIQNSDWRLVLDWDGHQPATEPGNPNIVYAERQEGYLSRIDMATGEIVDIQPQADDGDPFERFNWDAPILVSPHNPTRLYVASQRIWKSDNRGDQWVAISDDLTRDQNRIELPIMGGAQSWDNPWDFLAMSTYNTITSLAESPLQEGLLYAGTDDGLVHVSEDGGENWTKIEVGSMPGVPKTAFVNDIRADLHDADTVYLAMDNHKFGDFKPYLLKSTNRGKSWQPITGNLPERLLVWRMVQDHVKPELMFLATEFGIYFTHNAGANWTQLKGGLPTISFRDIHIHRRENDLVCASFGRSIYILDDLAPLREVTNDTFENDGSLFATRDAWWYFPRPHLSFSGKKGDQGAGHFVADNPEFGAVFTYHLKDDLRSKGEQRKEAEKAARKDKKPTPFGGWDAAEAERRDAGPSIWLTIKDEQGNVIRRIAGETKKGFHRTAWDLRYPEPDAIKLVPDPPPMWPESPSGQMCAPGKYSVTLSTMVDGNVTELGEQSFEVKPLRSGSLESAEPAKVAAFWRDYENAVRQHTMIKIALTSAIKKGKRMKVALGNTPAAVGELDEQLAQLQNDLEDLNNELNGDQARQMVGEKFTPIINDRLFSVARGVDRSTYGPTATHQRMLDIANEQIESLSEKIQTATKDLSSVAKALMEQGGPWVEGEAID